MATAVDAELARTYCSLYPYISGFAHGGSPLALASYIEQTGAGATTSLAAPSEAELSEALVAGLFAGDGGQIKSRAASTARLLA